LALLAFGSVFGSLLWSTGCMKTSTKNLLIGIVVVVLAVVVASWIVNIALTFLAVAFKFALVALVAVVLLVFVGIWWARTRD
jgi:uncharacterized protein YacL